MLLQALPEEIAAPEGEMAHAKHESIPAGAALTAKAFRAKITKKAPGPKIWSTKAAAPIAKLLVDPVEGIDFASSSPWAMPKDPTPKPKHEYSAGERIFEARMAPHVPGKDL